MGRVRAALALVVLGACLPAAAAPGSREQEQEEEDEKRPLIISTNPNLEVKLSGRIHRMVQAVEDGRETGVFFTDSLQGPTILRFDVTGRPSETLSIGGSLEIGLQQNNPLFVSQDNPDAGIDVSGRIAEFFLDSRRFGRFSLGRGFAAAWVAPEVDLSGTVFASLLPVGNLFPGLKFVNSETKELTDVRVVSHFADLERLLLADRFRYDSPGFGGFKLSGSIAADSRWDTALRFRRTLGSVTVSGATTYQNEPFLEVDWRWDGGLSARHDPTGLNLTVGGSTQRQEDGRDADSFLVKAGKLSSWWSIGQTAFSVDFTENDNVVLDGDRARSVGAFVLQSWDRFGVRFYGGVRRYSVDRSDAALKPMTLVPFGFLIMF